jgi:D-alanyl-lipoteichoic acid acyltransferase DltB (MBOAT superfamily)
VIGAAQVFGFKIEENFDAPYLALTPAMFWSRWHMSLSSWIRDYVFTPIAMLRRDTWWHYVALLFSMSLFGLWHHGTLTFLMWGTYQGVLLIMHRIGQQYFRKVSFTSHTALESFLSWFMTFLAISLGWILFGADDLNQALTMFHAVVSPAAYARLTLSRDFYGIVLTIVSGYFLYGVITRNGWVRQRCQQMLVVSDNATKMNRMIQFSWKYRWLWATPMVTILVIFAALAVLLQPDHVKPFMYAGY